MEQSNHVEGSNCEDEVKTKEPIDEKLRSDIEELGRKNMEQKSLLTNAANCKGANMLVQVNIIIIIIWTSYIVQVFLG